MFEYISRRTVLFVLTGAVGSYALYGCSGNSTGNTAPSSSPSAKPSYRVSQACTPQTGTWEKAPSGLNVGRIMQALGQGVTADEINKSTIGNAECPTGIIGDNIKNATPESVIAVPGQGDLCLAIGENTGGPLPQGGKAYTDIIAICPAMGGASA